MIHLFNAIDKTAKTFYYICVLVIGFGLVYQLMLIEKSILLVHNSVDIQSVMNNITTDNAVKELVKSRKTIGDKPVGSAE
jgi:hypothetical protein